jgi:actin-related protein 8
MKACTAHLFPSAERTGTPAPAGDDTPTGTPAPNSQPGASATPTPAGNKDKDKDSASTPNPHLVPPTTNPSAAATPAPDGEAEDPAHKYDIAYEASKSPLDGAIAASISLSASENKVKTAANSILLVGGGSGLKGLAPFISDR